MSYQIHKCQIHVNNFCTHLSVGEPKGLKLDLTVLLVHGEPVKVHIAGHVIVDPDSQVPNFQESDIAYLVLMNIDSRHLLQRR